MDPLRSIAIEQFVADCAAVSGRLVSDKKLTVGSPELLSFKQPPVATGNRGDESEYNAASCQRLLNNISVFQVLPRKGKCEKCDEGDQVFCDTDHVAMSSSKEPTNRISLRYGEQTRPLKSRLVFGLANGRKDHRSS
ncbi:hypothetical protein EYF80_036251 [Liparis tanakae]|uniref:Uncharacterized protein n=1 Tax=Liparis tanakae TaxID=230148 RepID=A0A4Z2GK12_9TELE|nr:hypothetical protein EYF80_036251 [Liparis tanakae]